LIALRPGHHAQVRPEALPSLLGQDLAAWLMEQKNITPLTTPGRCTIRAAPLAAIQTCWML
jgi:hypothetical protein